MHISKDRRVIFLSQYLNQHQQWLSLVETSEFTVRRFSLTSVVTPRGSWTVEISRLEFLDPVLLVCLEIDLEFFFLTLLPDFFLFGTMSKHDLNRIPVVHNWWFLQQLPSLFLVFDLSSLKPSFLPWPSFLAPLSVSLSETSSAAWGALRDCGWKDNHSKPVTAHRGHGRQQMCCHQGKGNTSFQIISTACFTLGLGKSPLCPPSLWQTNCFGISVTWVFSRNKAKCFQMITCVTKWIFNCPGSHAAWPIIR